MILSADRLANLGEPLEKLGIGVALKESNSVLLKINLSRPPEPGHPRTDPALLTKVIQYLSDQGADCAIAEAANGFLYENIERIGLGTMVKEQHVRVIDLDLEDFDSVAIEDETHYLPKCLREYGIRIAIPALSKRPEMIFSNNVKLFVGVVPRCMYQIGERRTWRPRVHINLHRSVANIYRAVMCYAPFGFFINGGRMMIEEQAEMETQQILIGDNALELDLYQLQRLNLEVPEYLTKLQLLLTTY